MRSYRIGSNDPIKVNVRVVSATHRDLEALVAEGKFRQDLYFRLNRLKVRLPPLRERREDIPILAAHFLKEFNELHGKHVTGIAEPVRRAMAAYHWEGNVRELRNAIESMVVLDHDGILNMDDVEEDSSAEARAGTDARAARAEQSGRPAADGGGALLHRAGVGTDRRQARGGGEDARHRRADAVSRHQGLGHAGQDQEGAGRSERRRGGGGEGAGHERSGTDAEDEEIGTRIVRA